MNYVHEVNNIGFLISLWWLVDIKLNLRISTSRSIQHIFTLNSLSIVSKIEKLYIIQGFSLGIKG